MIADVREAVLGAERREPSFFSMLRLSGIHTPNRHRTHMAFAAYYDGSGKPDQAAITLTGVAAPEILWKNFECSWVIALDHNEVVDRDFHMTDLMSQNGKFADWDDRKRRRLLKDLFNVLGCFRTVGLSAYSCTVLMGAYNEAKSQFPALRKPEAFCVNYCVGGLQLTEEQLQSEPRPILLYFDRNEGFLHTVNRVWERHRKKKTGWPSQVRNIIPADRFEYFPIQAADMLAWIVNRCRRDALARGEAQPYQRLIFSDEIDQYKQLFASAWIMVDHHMRWYDDPQQFTVRPFG